MKNYVVIISVLAILLSGCGGGSDEDEDKLQLICVAGCSDSTDDTIPNKFIFRDKWGVLLNSSIVSDTIRVSGITKSTISISGGSYSINGRSYRNSEGVVRNGDIVKVRLMSSDSVSSMSTAMLTIGNASATFNVTTMSVPVKQLTNNSNGDHSPQIHNGQVVWENKGILFYDDATGLTTRLTEAGQTGLNPQIYNGQVVWSGKNTNGIFFYNHSTREVAQLTDDNDSFAVIHNGQVAWLRGDGNEAEVFFHDTVTGLTTQLSNNNRRDYPPQLHNGQVVWQSGNGNGAEIFFYDSEVGMAKQLTNNNKIDELPKIHNGQVVWDGGYGFGNEIFLYDSETQKIIQITDNDRTDESPYIHNGQVVWVSMGREDFMSLSFRSDIFLYDIETKITLQLTETSRIRTNPKISNGQIVWMSGTDFDTVFYDGATEKTTILPNKSLANSYKSLQINGGQVVWSGMDKNEYDFEIFSYDSRK